MIIRSWATFKICVSEEYVSWFFRGFCFIFFSQICRVSSQWKWCCSVAIAFMAFMWIRWSVQEVCSPLETLHINWLSSLRKVTLGPVTYEYTYGIYIVYIYGYYITVSCVFVSNGSSLFAFWLFIFASSSISILMYRLYIYLCHQKWALILEWQWVLPDTGRISWSSCLVKEDMVETTFIHMLVMSWPSLLFIFQNPLSDVRILDISLVLEELMSEYLDVSTLRNIQVQHAAMFNEDWSTAYEVCWQASGAAPRSWWKNLGMDCHPGIS